jgi:hypothetical protein
MFYSVVLQLPLITLRHGPHGKPFPSTLLECLFTGPLPQNGCSLLSSIVVHITHKRSVYQESVSVGTCLSIRCLAVVRDVTVLTYS